MRKNPLDRPVKDFLGKSYCAIDADKTILDAVKCMDENKTGTVIVTEDGKPVGVITEKDIVVRVVAKDLQPSKITAKEIMTSPLITIDPDETINEAARRMSRLNIRRLGVMYKGSLVGIISSKDILNVTPELIEIMQERARIEEGSLEELESPPSAGYCDNCGSWSDDLREVEGNFLCEECRLELRTPKY